MLDEECRPVIDEERDDIDDASNGFEKPSVAAGLRVAVYDEELLKAIFVVEARGCCHVTAWTRIFAMEWRWVERVLPERRVVG